MVNLHELQQTSFSASDLHHGGPFHAAGIEPPIAPEIRLGDFFGFSVVPKSQSIPEIDLGPRPNQVTKSPPITQNEGLVFPIAIMQKIGQKDNLENNNKQLASKGTIFVRRAPGKQDNRNIEATSGRSGGARTGAVEIATKLIGQPPMREPVGAGRPLPLAV